MQRIIKTQINFYKLYNFYFFSRNSSTFHAYNSTNTLLSTRVIKQKHNLNKPPIIITPAAASRINDIILSKNPIPLGIRIGIHKRGCNGLTYTMNYVIDNSDTKTIIKDIIVKADNGVLIYIDPSALFNIVGTVMDWKDDDISQEFTFLNPKSKGTCGCGESFNI
jgi:iron-sulfur cluster assembly accessory protein